ncbi:MAG: hypothetical protein LBB87_00600 [Nitrososphaerota archaeon]|jgi:N-acetylneuraminic acid mutarotase|nr:hypothetical protein [Nitrososphaerota archaeon]
MNKLVSLLLLFFLISGTFVAVFSHVFASELVEDSWNIKTPLKYPREKFVTVIFDGKIYAIGGYGSHGYGGSYVGTTERYDPKTDKWTTLAPMPTPRTEVSVVVYQGKIYCMGGVFSISGRGITSKTDAVEVYDPVTNKWSKKASLPFEPSSTAYVINDQLFVIERWGRQMYVYNPFDDSWSSKTALPVIMSDMTAIVIDDNLFAIVKNGENELWEMFMYDSVIDSWTKKATPFLHDTPFSHNLQTSPYSTFTSTVVDDKIIVCQTTYSYYMESVKLNINIYDTKLDKWSEGKTSPETYIASYVYSEVTSGVYAPKKLYAFGYEQNDQNMQPFVWVYDPENNVWSTAKAMPTGVVPSSPSNGKLVVVDDIFYMLHSYSLDDFNAQYIPIGYLANDPPSNQPPSLNALIVVVAIVLTVSLVTTGLFFYLKKRKFT